MAGAMDEVIAVAGGFDHLAGGAIGLLATYYAPLRDATLNQLDGGVARAGHGPEDLREGVGHGHGRTAHPGEIAVDTFGRLLFGKQVEQNQIAVPDRRVALLAGAEMRIRGVGVDRHDRRFIGAQTMRGDPAEHETLDRELGARQMMADAARDFRKALVDDFAQMA